MKNIINKINFFWTGNPVGIVAIWIGTLFIIYMVLDTLHRYNLI